jgi:PPM family protein phosphatase
VRLEHGERSDVGRTRSGNEDSFLIDDSIGLYVVADGMGGHRAGEVASATAVSALRASMSPSQPITAAVADANAAVYAKAGLDPELLGMGTTVTAAVLSGNQCYIAHVGDSRCYLLRDGQLTRLTLDHSFVEQLVRDGQLTPEQAAVHPKRSILTHGLTGMVREDGIALLLTENPAPQDAADRLIDAANANGGEDNITAVVVDVVDDGTEGLPAVYLTEPPAEGMPTARVIAVPPGPGTYADGPTVETDPSEAAQAVRDAMTAVAAMETRGEATDAETADAAGPFAVPEPRMDPAFPAPQGFDDAPDAAGRPAPVALADPAPATTEPPAGAPGTAPSERAGRPTWVVPAIVAGVALVVVVVLVLVLAGGGGDDDDAPASTTTSTEAETTTTRAATTTTASTSATTADGATGATTGTTSGSPRGQDEGTRQTAATTSGSSSSSASTASTVSASTTGAS